MTRPKKRKADDEITEAITPDSFTSKKLRGRNLPIQRPATQSDKLLLSLYLFLLSI